MRIGHVTFTYLPIRGGGDVYIAQLYDLLTRQGHSQKIYQKNTGLKHSELRVVPNPLKLFRRAEFWTLSFFLLLRLGDFLKDDLLLVYYPLYFLPLFSLRDKIICISHGVTWDDQPYASKSKIKKYIAQFAFKYAHKFIANDSHFFRQMDIDLQPMNKMFQEIEPNHWFIPNCVDTNYFQRREGIPEIRKLNPILVPRNFYYNRGIHLAIQAFNIFVKEHPETKLLIAGQGGQKSYGAYLFRLVDALKLKEKVIFYGSISWQEMPEIYSSALLTLIPSLCGEGTSLAALESMSCGTATISTNAGGLLDLPCVHCAADIQALTKTMFEVFEKRERIAQEQQEKVKETYNLKNWGNAWLRVILSGT